RRRMGSWSSRGSPRRSSSAGPAGGISLQVTASGARGGWLGRLRSAMRADRVDQLPLAHFRAARDAGSLGDFIELLAIAALERMPGLAAALASEPGLFLQSAARARGQFCDRALPGCGPL